MIFLFIGCLFLVIGGLFFMKPSKERNRLYGYKSERAMESKESWDYAQKVSRSVFFFGGILMCSIGLFLKLTNHTNFYLLEMIIIPWVIAPMFGFIEQKIDAFNRVRRGE